MEFTTTMRLFELLGGGRSVFLYSGAFPDDHTARLIALIEAFAPGRGRGKQVVNRSSFVAVEAYQNIIRHRTKDTDGMGPTGSSMFMLDLSDQNCRVMTINPVDKAETPGLVADLARLRRLDRDALKGLFLSGLQQQAQRARGGAGLGLIEMARRSENGLHHAVASLDEHRDLFLLEVTVGEGSRDAVPFEAYWELHRSISSEGVYMAQAGTIGPEAQEVLMAVVEQESGAETGRAYLAAMERMNLADEGPRNALVVLSRRTGRTALTFVRSMPAEKAEQEVGALQRTTALGPIDLAKRYREALAAQARGAQQGDLAMLDMAHGADGPLKWHLAERGDGTAVLAIRMALRPVGITRSAK